MMAAHLLEYPKNHRIVSFKWVKHMTCEFYLNKAVKKSPEGKDPIDNRGRPGVERTLWAGAQLMHRCRGRNDGAMGP